MKKILITGASGFVGSSLILHLMGKFRVFGTYFENPIRIGGCHLFHMDLRKTAEISQILNIVQPNIVIHCAGMSDIDECEKKPYQARNLNFGATEMLCRIAGPSGMQIIYISTDQVYENPSTHSQASHEYSLVKPLSVHSMAKLKAEEKVKDFCINYQIIRLSLCYGLSGGVNSCSTDWLDVSFRKRKSVQLYINQFRTPILIDDVCIAVEKIIEDSPSNEVYNIGGSQIMSRVDFGRLYASIFGYDDRLIIPTTYVSFADCAPRPLNSALDSSKFIQRFKFTPLNPEAGIKKLYLQKMMIV